MPLSVFLSANDRHRWVLALGLLSSSMLVGCGGGGGDDAASADASRTTDSLARVDATLTDVTSPTTAQGVGLFVSASTLTYLKQLNTNALSVGTVIDNFDGYAGADGSSIPNWTFIPGNEFPGARGGLSLATTSPGRHADLSADLGCTSSEVILKPSGCGRYVGATRYISTPFAVAQPAAARVQLRVRMAQPLLSPGLRVTDASGQTLQYKFEGTSIEGVASGQNWAKVAVTLRWPASYWGGDNNGSVRSSINGLSVLADQLSVVGPRGSMLVDDIRLLPNGASVLALTGEEALITQGVVPSTAGRLAVNARYYKVSNTSARLAAEAGFSVVRVDMFWESVESNGVFDFSIYDTVLRRLEQQGLKALFILDYGHPDHGGGAPITTQQRAAFLEFARQATRFAAGRNVVGFEVWNEPDNSKYWTDGNPETYATLLSEARAAIKAEDSTRRVTNGGPSWADLPYILNLAKTGALNQLDAFAIHGYRGKMNPPEGFAGDMLRVKQVLASRGVNLPIWMTEWGTSSSDLDEATYGNAHDARARVWQAHNLMRGLLTQVALNMPFANIYELYDSGTDPEQNEHNFGLLTNDLSIKPAYTAVKHFHTLTRDKTYKGLLRDLPVNVHGMKWEGQGQYVYAVWLDTGNANTRLVFPAAAQVFDMLGNPVTTTTGPNGTRELALTFTMGPVYVRM